MKELTLLEPRKLKHYNELKMFLVAVFDCDLYSEMVNQAKREIDYYEFLAKERAINIINLCNSIFEIGYERELYYEDD